VLLAHGEMDANVRTQNDIYFQENNKIIAQQQKNSFKIL
jgi:hypothetical protein